MNDDNKKQQSYDVTHGDVLEVLKTLPSNSYDGGFCDPPYGLGFMGKDWDQNVPGVEVWQEMLRVCKPGSYMMTFGSPKTFHRLTCYIEDAGWEIRDTLCWLYGEGFPKSQDFSEGIAQFSSHGNLVERFRGRGTTLKPAWEPIVLAMKATCGSYAKNAAHFGCAGLNIEGCRIGSSGGTKRSHQAAYPPQKTVVRIGLSGKGLATVSNRSTVDDGLPTCCSMKRRRRCSMTKAVTPGLVVVVAARRTELWATATR